MSLPIPIDKFCAELGVARSTVEGWAEKGEVMLWQPGGKGGKVFVRDERARKSKSDAVRTWVDAEKKKTGT